MNSRMVRIALTMLMVVFSICYSGYMAIRFFYSPYETITIFDETIADTVREKAVLIRLEEVIPKELPDTVIGYTRYDGEVILPGSTIATIYDTPESLNAVQQAEHIERELDTLLRAEANTAYITQNADAISAQINDAVGNIILSVQYDDLSRLYDFKEKFQYHYARKQSVSGVTFESRILQLQNEREYLLSKVSQGREIVSPIGGYFCSTTDGYEQLLTLERMQEMTAQELINAINGFQDALSYRTIGKTMQAHDWFTAMAVPSSFHNKINVGDRVTLDFGVAQCRFIPAVVDKILSDEASERVVVLLKSNRINDKLMNMRHATVELKCKSYSGLRVPADAIRFLEDVEGVYVLQSGRVAFRPLEIIYRGVDFVICDRNPENKPGQLKLFDEVITRGVNLYDGKVLR